MYKIIYTKKGKKRQHFVYLLLKTFLELRKKKWLKSILKTNIISSPNNSKVFLGICLFQTCRVSLSAHLIELDIKAIRYKEKSLNNT